MNEHCINIAISGLSPKSSHELKIELRNAIPNQYGINWINIADPNIDLLLINESFTETESIKKIITEKYFPFLKIAKNTHLGGTIHDNTLYIPLNNNVSKLKEWISLKLLNSLSQAPIENTIRQIDHTFLAPSFFKNMHDPNNARLHLFDQAGTLAIIDTRNNIAWLEPTRLKTSTNHHLEYDFAMTADFVKVSRKAMVRLDDWLWNLIWNSQELNSLSEGVESYKIQYWPQPSAQINHRKSVLQMSACFIAGAQLMQVAQQLNLPLATIQQFIAACIASNNGYEIPTSQCKFRLEHKDQNSDQGFIHKFFGKLRRRFGL